MDFRCKRCGFKTKTKGNLKHHLMRKTPCTPSLEEIPVGELIATIDGNKKEKTLACKCGKMFASRQGLYLHTRSKTCSDDSVTNPDNTIQVLMEKIKELEHVIKGGQKEDTIVPTPTTITNNKSGNGCVHACNDKLNKSLFDCQLLKKENQRLRNELLKYMTKRTEDFYQVIVENWLEGTHSTNTAGVTDVTNATTHAEIKGWKEWKHAMGQLMAYQTEDPKEHLYVCLFGKYDHDYKKKAIKVLNERGISCYEFSEKDGVVCIISVADDTIVFEYNLAQTNL